jgi:hypothetical protein
MGKHPKSDTQYNNAINRYKYETADYHAARNKAA